TRGWKLIGRKGASLQSPRSSGQKVINCKQSDEEDCVMPAVIEAPVEMIEAIADLRFPPKTHQLLQSLMDRNTEGKLTPGEREERFSRVKPDHRAGSRESSQSPRAQALISSRQDSLAGRNVRTVPTLMIP